MPYTIKSEIEEKQTRLIVTAPESDAALVSLLTTFANSADGDIVKYTSERQVCLQDRKCVLTITAKKPLFGDDHHERGCFNNLLCKELQIELDMDTFFDLLVAGAKPVQVLKCQQPKHRRLQTPPSPSAFFVRDGEEDRSTSICTASDTGTPLVPIFMNHGK